MMKIILSIMDTKNISTKSLICDFSHFPFIPLLSVKAQQSNQLYSGDYFTPRYRSNLNILSSAGRFSALKSDEHKSHLQKSLICDFCHFPFIPLLSIKAQQSNQLYNSGDYFTVRYRSNLNILSSSGRFSARKSHEHKRHLDKKFNL